MAYLPFPIRETARKCVQPGNGPLGQLGVIHRGNDDPCDGCGPEVSDCPGTGWLRTTQGRPMKLPRCHLPQWLQLRWPLPAAIFQDILPGIDPGNLWQDRALLLPCNIKRISGMKEHGG